MRKLLISLAGLLFLCASVWSQAETQKIKVRAVLVDKELNQKPVPHLAVVLSADSESTQASREVKTDLDGIVELLLPPGKYKLTTPQGVDFLDRHYAWGVEVSVGSEPVSIELSNDNAVVTDLPAAQPTRKVDDLTSMFQKYQRSVVTVWSEIGSGTGFIVDPAGLVMTNQHVIGPSEFVSIQFDEKRKVAAKVLAFDSERDVAVLYANLGAFPDALVAPIANGQADHPMAVEGERVFSIGSPLRLKKIITSGIVSKVEERAIISDVNINHGNSGGPLFNSLGEVIGITTFLVSGANGPGISGVVRIDQALPTLEQARKKMRDVSIPDSRLLPVEPTDPYPLDALKETIKSTKFDKKPYIFTMGGFDVALGTPVLKYEIQEEVSLAAQKEKGKRTKKREEAVQNTFEPLQELREWAEYVGEYKPVLLIQAEPQLRETFMSALGRGLASSEGYYGGPAHMKFKTDFYRMKLFCGTKEVEPIQPGKAATVANAHNAFVNVTDATYVGIYSYLPDAVSPSCGKVTLQLYSEKQPDKSESKDLDQKTIDRIWNDFRPYFDAHNNIGNSK
jgi:S1-C subfamily serine protease